jgi:hypothetical protein
MKRDLRHIRQLRAHHGDFSVFLVPHVVTW